MSDGKELDIAEASMRLLAATTGQKSLASVYERGGPGSRLDFERDAAEVAGWAVVAISRKREMDKYRGLPVDHEWLMANGGYVVECGDLLLRAWRGGGSRKDLFSWSLCHEDSGYPTTHPLRSRGQWLDLVSGVKG